MVGFYTSAEQEDEANLTEIEKERLKNIRQNRAVLQSAGLGGSYSILGHRKGSQQKKPRSTPAVKLPARVPTEPSRRSLRNLGKDAPDYRETSDFLLKEVVGSSNHRVPIGLEDAGEEDGPGEKWHPHHKRPRTSQPSTSSEPTPGSSKTLNANIEGMLSQYLGKKVPGTGKQLVMELLTMPGAGYAKFSKYSGVVEWKNALVLWVNADGNDYANMFLKEGKEMSWFAGSRVTAETPMLQRLLEAGLDPAVVAVASEEKNMGAEESSSSRTKKGGKKEKEEKGKDDDVATTSSLAVKKAGKRGKGEADEINSSNDDHEQEEEEEENQGGPDEILLFVRLTGEPYVCFGRVHHVWYETRRHPIKVIWRLRDYDAIKECPDFLEIVAPGGTLPPSSSSSSSADDVEKAK